jgi:hypothetical protein
MEEELEVKVTWDVPRVGVRSGFVLSALNYGNPTREAIALLLECNDTVTLRDEGLGCTLVYRKEVN